MVREDFAIHHTVESMPADVCEAPYHTHSMSFLPMFGDSVRTTPIAMSTKMVCSHDMLSANNTFELPAPGLNLLADMTCQRNKQVPVRLTPVE